MKFPLPESGHARKLRHEQEEGRIMRLFDGPTNEVSTHVVQDYSHRLGFEAFNGETGEERAIDAVRRLVESGELEFDALHRRIKLRSN